MRKSARRSSVEAIIFVGLAACIGWLLVATRPTGLWPMYQHDPTHNAVVHDGFPAVRWKLQLRKQINSGLSFDGTYVYTDDFAGDLVAINPKTGKIVWKRTVDNVLMSTPAVSNGRVFVGSGANDVMWDSPRDTLWARPRGDRQYAFSRTDGKELWSYRVIGEAMPSAAYAGGMVMFATGDGRAYALDEADGHQLWVTRLRGVSTMASAMIDGGKVFFVASMGKFWRYRPDQNHVVALNIQGGSVAWTAPFGNADCAVTIANGMVYVEGTTDVRGRRASVVASNSVVALRERDGKLLWRYESAPGAFNNIGSSERGIAGMYDNGTLYQSIPAVRQFAALDSATGAVKWIAHTAAAVKMSAVLDGGRLYFGDTSGRLYVIDSATGRVLNVRRYPKIFTTSPPIIVGKTLMIANKDAVLAMPLTVF